jgi:hypothetical protein
MGIINKIKKYFYISEGSIIPIGFSWNNRQWFIRIPLFLTTYEEKYDIGWDEKITAFRMLNIGIGWHRITGRLKIATAWLPVWCMED